MGEETEVKGTVSKVDRHLKETGVEVDQEDSLKNDPLESAEKILRLRAIAERTGMRRAKAKETVAVVHRGKVVHLKVEAVEVRQEDSLEKGRSKSAEILFR